MWVRDGVVVRVGWGVRAREWGDAMLLYAGLG